VISRYLLIALALGASGYRIGQGAWVEATGLGALGLGLLALQLSNGRGGLRAAAWAAFLVTAVAMGVAFMRMR
jgi:hypothetical protein